MRREQKMVSVQRVRKAIHHAYEVSRQTGLEKMKREKTDMSRKITNNREKTLEEMREGVKSNKLRNNQRRKLAGEIKKLGTKGANDTTFGQYLRTVEKGGAVDKVEKLEQRVFESSEYIEAGVAITPLDIDKMKGFSVRKPLNKCLGAGFKITKTNMSSPTVADGRHLIAEGLIAGVGDEVGRGEVELKENRIYIRKRTNKLP